MENLSKCCLYADDTAVITKSTSMNQLELIRQDSMRKAQEWFTVNKLRINAEKTDCIYFSAVPPTMRSIKLLGVHFDYDLK